MCGSRSSWRKITSSSTARGGSCGQRCSLRRCSITQASTASWKRPIATCGAAGAARQTTATLEAGMQVDESEPLARARASARSGQWELAEQLYRDIVRGRPDQVDALEGLGLLALQARRANEAQ